MRIDTGAVVYNRQLQKIVALFGGNQQETRVRFPGDAVSNCVFDEML